jgi:hypothetical protein
VNANDLILYLIGDKDTGRLAPASTVLGRFGFRYLQWSGTAGSGALRLDLQFTSDVSALAESRFVWLRAEVQNAYIQVRTRGQVTIDADKWPVLQAAGTQSQQWEWRLLPEDIEAIEAETPSTERWRTFKLEVSGMVQIGPEVRPFSGSSNFSVPLSEWEDLLRYLGYGVPPSAANLAGVAVTLHPSWADAQKRLEPARQALRTGDTHRALTLCLDQFAGLAEKPYQATSWLPKLPDDPTQKRESVAGLLAAHCTYLNRVGYHRDSDHPDGTGLQPMPLDHWEAEIALAASQFWLTLALREMAGN